MPEHFKLVTVNPSPERATLLLNKLSEKISSVYTIEHIGNIEKIEDVEAKLKELQPDLVFAAASWSDEEAEKIKTIAASAVPNAKTQKIPAGIAQAEGPEGVLKYIQENFPQLIEQWKAKKAAAGA